VIDWVMKVNNQRPQGRDSVLWSFLFVWLLFCGVSFLGTPVPGVNEPHYLCKARAMLSADWCNRDFFLSSQNVHICFLQLAGWALGWMSFALVAVVGRVISAGILAWGWLQLSGAVLRDGWCRAAAASLFSVLTLTGDFTGEWILGGLESKVPAWGLGWGAAGLWIEGMTTGRQRLLVWGGLSCGMSVAMHPVAGGWFGLGIAGATFLRVFGRGIERREFRGLVVFAAAAVVASLPGLIPAVRFLMGSGELVAVRERASFIQVYWRLRHHMDPTAIRVEQWLWAVALLTATAMAGFGLLVRIERRADAISGGDGAAVDDRATVSMEGLRRLGLLLCCASIVAALGVCVGWHGERLDAMEGWQWRASLLRFYPFRFFDGLLPCVAGIVLVCVWVESVGRGRVPLRLGRGAGVGWICVMGCAAAWVLASANRSVAPGGYSAGSWQEWQQVCGWLRANVQRDALVLTPRESFGFKWLAERAEYVSYKDCPQDAAGIVEWDRRLWRVHGWSAASLADGKYDDEDLGRLRRELGCEFVLIRAQEPFSRVPIWSGRYWKVYTAN
jgi:hypothetical protein